MAEKKRLLIYAHYYVPDTASTGQILRELAEGMLDTFDITVICVVPSYFGTIDEKYKTQKYYKENINGVKVLRIRVPEFNKTNKLSRIKNILGYYFGAMAAAFKVGRQDYVFSISQPPVLGGLIGVWGKWIKHAKYIYNIQDFNPEQVMAVGYSKNKLILKVMMLLDYFSCKRSNLIITVGRDMIETLNKRFTRNPPKSILINNWIDENEIYPLEVGNEMVESFKKQYGLAGKSVIKVFRDNKTQKKYISGGDRSKTVGEELDKNAVGHSPDAETRKYIIMYSGNLGLYYDLENLMKVIQRFPSGTKTVDGREVIFVFVGSGSIKNKLVSYKEEHCMDNVEFIPYQDKADLNYSLNAADVHWCVNAKGIKGVSCPSKYYGIMAAGKPVLGVLEKGSEVRCLIEETNGGLCCEPGDYEGVGKNIQWFLNHAGDGQAEEMGRRAHEYLMKNLTREKSIRKYKEEILKL